MNILHTQFTLQQLRLNITDHEYVYPHHLTQEADEIWEDLNSKHTIWNGIVYRLVTFSKTSNTLDLTLGLTDYKATQTASRMQDAFAKMHFSERPNAMYVSGPILTRDNYYIFSKKHSSSIQTHSINFVGGSLNKDEFVLASPTDIAETFKKELYEELKIPASDVIIENGLGIVETNTFRIALVFQAEYQNTWQHLSEKSVLNTEHSELINVHKDTLNEFLHEQAHYLNPLIPAILSAK